MTDIVNPVPLPDAPPVPQREDPATFEDRVDDGYEFIFEKLPPALEALNENTYQNAVAAKERAQTADERAADAEDARDAAEAARDKAQEWAEFDGEPVPGSKSAKGWAEESEAAKDSAWAAAAAAGSSAGLPEPLVPGKVLGATGPDTVGWVDSIVTGDTVFTARELSSPEWLPCDGSLYLKSSYPDLYAEVGQLPVGGGDVWLAVPGLPSSSWYRIAYLNGLFLLGGSSANAIHTSVDGINWTSRNTGMSSTGLVYGFAYGNGVYVAINHLKQVSVSSDGETWQVTTTIGSSTPNDLAFGNGVFVAAADGGDIYTSPDGTVWTRRNIGLSSNATGITFGKGLFVVSLNSGFLAVSSNGIDWSTTRPIVVNWQGVGYGDGLFVAVGSSGQVVTSPDGLVWTPRPSGTTAILRAVGYGAGLFILGGITGTLLVSSDGIQWAPRAFPNNQNIRSAAYGNGVYLAVATDGGTVARSLDGYQYDTESMFAVPSVGSISANGGTNAYIKT